MEAIGDTFSHVFLKLGNLSLHSLSEQSNTTIADACSVRKQIYTQMEQLIHFCLEYLCLFLDLLLSSLHC